MLSSWQATAGLRYVANIRLQSLSTVLLLRLTPAGQEASRKLREAAALGQDNPEVQAAFLKLHQHEDESPLKGLCRRYAVYNNAKAGDDAVALVQNPEFRVSDVVALESLKIILGSNNEALSGAQDVIIAQLMRQYSCVRAYFASELQASSTEFFGNIYYRGDEAANCLRIVVLDQSLWPSEDVRLQVEDDLFQLLMAKLMESGHDLDGRALRGLALLLMADVKRLSAFIDQEGFDAILSSLDTRLPSDVRSQATVVASKYLETAEEEGSKYFAEFVTKRIARQKAESLVIAFSAAVALFPVSPAITAPLFLTEGFLPLLVPLLDRKFANVQVHDTFLQLLNAACIDSNCRTAISRTCSTWLSHKVSNGTGTQPTMAATVLTKLRTSQVVNPSKYQATGDGEDVKELVSLFKHNLVENDETSTSESVEGLAYASLKPDVKEELSHDTAFFKALLEVLDDDSQRPDAVVGALSIITNLTQYAPTLSDEQRKMSELKAYANASNPLGLNPLDDDHHVTARCDAVVRTQALPVLVRVSKSSSSSVKRLIDGILLSLSRNPKNRGTLAQQGAVKLLISHLKDASPSEAAAQALARILISVDPSHIFPASGTPHITAAISPLVALLKPDAASGLQDGPRDLLPTFEALLALTNLASSPDASAPNLIARQAWDSVEDLLLGNHTLVRRAACELVCNLVVCEEGAAKYLDGSKRATQRLHILLAMADVEDMVTRRAAGGALAMLTEYGDSATKAILEVKRGPEIIMGLCRDDEEEIIHRGVVCVRNMASTADPTGSNAKEALKAMEAPESLRACLRQTRNANILQVGVEALKLLME